jgi:hypothetical protein
MRAKHIILIAFFLLAVSGTVVGGGGNRSGTSGAQELLIPVGAHGVSLGGSFLATTSGVEAIFWNPAGLASMSNSVGVLFSHMRYIADINMEYAAVGVNFSGFGSLGLSLKSLSFGDILLTTEDAPDGIGTYSPTFVTLGLTYSRKLTDKISVGVTTNLVTERIQRTSASGLAFSAGVQYHGLGGIKGLSLALALKNLGPDMTFDGSDLYRTADAQQTIRGSQLYKVQAAPFGMPSSLEMGLSYEYRLNDQNSLTLTGLFQNNNYSDDEYKVGLEYAYTDLLFLRGAYSFAPEIPNKDDYIYGPSFGVGVHYFAGLDMTVEYAYRWVRYFDPNHVISLTLGF